MEVRSLAHLLDAVPDELEGDEALTDGSSSLDWAGYRRRADQYAALLRQRGVRRGDRVALHLTKSVESFCAVHGVLRAGAVVVPLDPQAAVTVLAEVYRDAEPAALISDARPAVLDPLREATSPEVLIVPDAVDLTSVEPTGRPDVGPDDPAYIIYTSGSTGRPKGIVHTHSSALAYARAARNLYELGPSDRHANIAPLHFDQSTFELYAAPLAGAAVVVVPTPVMRFPASLAAFIEDHRVTVWYSVPFLLTQLLARGELSQRDLTSLRWVLFGGEVFPPNALTELMKLLPGARFSNVYGPAEVNQCTDYEPTSPPIEPLPIGRPWDIASVLIVDPTQPADRAALTDGPGVLLVAGETMMQGYWMRPELTAASIVERADRSGDQRRFYVTGDLVVERDDGQMEFLGRVDNQVKVRGYRIELEAVDAALGDQPTVEAATVVVARGADDRLVGLVVASDDFDERTALTALRDRLPHYAVPSAIRSVRSLPRTGTGKIDRTAATALLDVTTEA